MPRPAVGQPPEPDNELPLDLAERLCANDLKVRIAAFRDRDAREHSAKDGGVALSYLALTCSTHNLSCTVRAIAFDLLRPSLRRTKASWRPKLDQRGRKLSL